MSAGAIIAAKQNKYSRKFRDAGATDAQNAKTLKEVGCLNSLVFHRLVDRGVFVAVSDLRFHLDEAAAEAFLTRRRNVMLSLVCLVLAVILVLWGLGVI